MEKGFVVFVMGKESKIPMVGFCKTTLLAEEFIDYAFDKLGEKVNWCIQDVEKLKEFKGEGVFE